MTVHAPPAKRQHCAACGGALTGRQRTVCSHSCQVARSRGQSRGALRETKSCAYCEDEFVPRRADARYCDHCRRARPWRREPELPTELDPRKLWKMLEDCEAIPRLNGSRRTLERHRDSGRPVDYFWFDQTTLTDLRASGLPILETDLDGLWVA